MPNKMDTHLRPKISIVIPIHDMKGGDAFLWRSINAITGQSFKDYEIIIVKEGKMAENTNAGIRRARGELIKILYLDDYFAHKDALKEIVEAFKGDMKWLVTGCKADKAHMPHFPTFGIGDMDNHIGSPSVLTIRNGLDIYFDEKMSWLLDLDYYKRLYARYGSPSILNTVNVIIGTGDHQMTNILTPEEKKAEDIYLKSKYA